MHTAFCDESTVCFDCFKDRKALSIHVVFLIALGMELYARRLP